MKKEAIVNLEHLADNDLLLLFANGDAGAARILTSRLMPTIFRHAYHRIYNQADAEDITQEAFMRLWKISPNWQQQQVQVSSWLYRVTENLCIDRLRKKKTSYNIEALDNELEDNRPTADTMIQEKERLNALNEALATLPERQALAIRLRHINGLSNIEITEIMRLSDKAVQSLLARGKRALKARLIGQKTALGYDYGTA